jgi:hypothetical protein
MTSVVHSYVPNSGNLELVGKREGRGKVLFSLKRLKGPHSPEWVFQDLTWSDAYREVSRRFPDPIAALDLADPVVSRSEATYQEFRVRRMRTKLERAQRNYDDALRLLAVLRDGLEPRD